LNFGGEGGRVLHMKKWLEKNALSEQQRRAMEEVGGELLEGSGFESELPKPDFSGSEAPALAPPDS
jgi:hypothetical protein